MGKLLVGILIGAVLGASGHAWLATPPAAEVATASSLHSTAAIAQPSPDPKPSVEQPKPMKVAAPAFDPASIAATPEDIAAANAANPPPPDRAPTRRHAMASGDDLQEGFGEIVAKDRLHPNSVSQLYEDYVGQQSGTPWSESTQRGLSDYLMRSAGARGFELLAVNCRESLCQVQARTYPGPDRGLAWSDVMHEVYRANPPLNLGVQQTRMDAQNGQVYVLTFIARGARR